MPNRTGKNGPRAYGSKVDIYMMMCAFVQIYAVQSLDCERIGQAKQEFQVKKN